MTLTSTSTFSGAISLYVVRRVVSAVFSCVDIALSYVAN